MSRVKSKLKLVILSISVFLLVACENEGVQKPQPYPSIRVATYNINVAQVGGIDAVVEAIEDLDADIIGLQEVDNMALRSAKHNPSKVPINEAKYIAEKLGMNFYFCMAIKLSSGGEYGTAILSKHPMKLRKRIELPNKEGVHPRSACGVDVVIPNYPKPVLAINTHLYHRQDELLREQVGHVTHQFSSWYVKDGALPIMTGDMNLFPNSDEYKLLTTTWSDTDESHIKTAPSWSPDRTIDYILTSNSHRWKINSVWVPKTIKL